MSDDPHTLDEYESALAFAAQRRPVHVESVRRGVWGCPAAAKSAGRDATALALEELVEQGRAERTFDGRYAPRRKPERADVAEPPDVTSPTPSPESILDPDVLRPEEPSECGPVALNRYKPEEDPDTGERIYVLLEDEPSECKSLPVATVTTADGSLTIDRICSPEQAEECGMPLAVYQNAIEALGKLDQWTVTVDATEEPEVGWSSLLEKVLGPEPPDEEETTSFEFTADIMRSFSDAAAPDYASPVDAAIQFERGEEPEFTDAEIRANEEMAAEWDCTTGDGLEDEYDDDEDRALLNVPCGPPKQEFGPRYQPFTGPVGECSINRSSYPLRSIEDVAALHRSPLRVIRRAARVVASLPSLRDELAAALGCLDDRRQLGQTTLAELERILGGRG